MLDSKNAIFALCFSFQEFAYFCLLIKLLQDSFILVKRLGSMREWNIWNSHSLELLHELTLLNGNAFIDDTHFIIRYDKVTDL